MFFMGAWGKIGINCFVLITGWFMCESRITARKFVKLFLEVMFYRLVIGAIFWATGYEAFSVIGLVKLLVPIRSISTDFTSAYLTFYLFMPFLNILIQHMDEKHHFYLLLLCGFTYVWLGTLPGFSVTMNYVSWFMVVYLIAAYLRKYPKKHTNDEGFWRSVSMACIAIDLLSVVFGAYLTMRWGDTYVYRFVMGSNSLLAIATGIALFMWFRKMRIGYCKAINVIGASTFGVLLIHANGDVMRQWLWKDLIDVVGHYEMALMPIYMIGCVSAIFAVCTSIDWLRIRFIERPFFEVWDARWEGIAEKYLAIEGRVFSKLGISSR